MNQEDIRNHIQEVMVWLSENVARPETPSTVTVFDVKFDWSRFSGSFLLALDELVLERRFGIRVEMNGQFSFSTPMFHSPLGAPASYAAVEMSEETSTAVTSALHQIFPSLRAMGFHKDTGAFVTQGTPFLERVVDMDDFLHKKTAIDTGNLSVSIHVAR